MESIFDQSLHFLRRVFLKLSAKGNSSVYDDFQSFEYNGQAVSDLIYKKLMDDKPCMIARFGSTELRIIVEYLNSKKDFSKYIDYVLGNIDDYKFTETSFYIAHTNSGIFPANQKILSEMSELMLQDAKYLDILGSWVSRERFITSYFDNVIKVRLAEIEPYYHQNTWTEALEGKTVLVIHPFTDTITKQYQKRELLFENKKMLPKFELKTIKAVQSLGNTPHGFSDWFEALNHMKKQVDAMDFDIAILGCGAYGFPLAAHIKRIGKKAVHMGGASQILFGIRGKRWEDHPVISKLFNEHWARPDENETPTNSKNVEDGCYW